MQEDGAKNDSDDGRSGARIAPRDQLGGPARSGIGGRLRALRDYGPGSGSFGAWVRPLRRRVGARIGSLRRRAESAWAGLEATNRHRIAAGAIVAATVLLIWLVLIPAAPCGFPGGDDCLPSDDAIALVPEDALAYAHLDIDPDSDQYAAASSIADRIPLLTRIAEDALGGIAGVDVDFQRQIEPWAGGEVALAALPTGLRGERVVMIEAEDTAAADRFAAGLLGPKQASATVDGTEVSVGRRGASWAIEDDFLLIGSRAGLAAMLAEDAGSLEDAGGTAVLDELPEQRVAYAYVSPDGARALFGSGSPIDTFVDSAATEGAAASLTTDEAGLSVAVRSDLDTSRSVGDPGFFAALPRFTPTLAANVGPSALAYLGLGDPEQGVGDLLDQARSSSPGLVAAFQRASRELGGQAGIDIRGDLLPLLGSEAALSLQPVPAGGQEPVPGVTPDSATPYVSLIAKDVDVDAARQSLARLQGPVAKALADNGRSATFETIQIAGVQAQALAVSPAVDLTYATWDDLLVIATDSLGIQQARSLDSGLDESTKFEDVTDGLPDSVSLLAYLDLTGLLALGEQAGLATDPAYTAYAPDLRSLTAAGLAVVGGADEIATDLRIAVGPRQTPEVDAPPLGE